MAAPERLRARVTPWLVFTTVIALVFVLFFSQSMNSSLNHDEHQFVTSAVLLTRGGFLPYRDYPYFHMPNQVYLYGALTWWTPYKLLVARIVQVLCGTAIAGLLCASGWRLLGRMDPFGRWLTAGGLLLVLVSSRVFTYTSGLAWNHDTSTLCALAALLLHLRGLSGPRPTSLALSGLLLGCAIGIRLSFAPVVVPFLLSFWLSRSPLLPGQRAGGLLLWSLGMTVGVLPAIVPLVTVPSQFIFGNLGYPRLSAPVYLKPVQVTLPQKIGFFLYKFIDEPADAVLLILFLYCATFAAWRARAWSGPHRDALLLTLGVLIALVPGVLAPTPSQRQYAYPLLPFMLLAVVYVFASAPKQPAARWTRLTAAALIVVATSGLPGKYEDVIFLLTPSHWTPIREHEVGEWIKSATPPDALVLTTTPITPIEGGLRVYPEFVTGVFAWRNAAFLPPEDRERYRMISAAELGGLLARRPPDAVFFDRRSEFVQPFIDYAQARGYRRVDPTSGTYALWVRPAAAAFGRESGTAPSLPQDAHRLCRVSGADPGAEPRSSTQTLPIPRP